MTTRLAMDHNFPEPLIKAIAPYVPEVEFVWLRDIDSRLPKLPDREMIIALYQLGWVGLITNDCRMLRAPRELAALVTTNLGFFGVEGVGHDPVRAAGAVLLDLPGVLKDFAPGRGAIFRMKPRRPQGEKPWDVWTKVAKHRHLDPDLLYREERVTAKELGTLILT